MANLLDLRADYAMGKESRFRRTPSGIPLSGSGADYHYRSETDFLRMIELARHFDRDVEFIGQGITRVCDNVLQEEGIVPDAETGDEGIDAELNARWEDWAGDPDQCDDQGEVDFAAIQHSVLRAVLVDGDQFVIPTADGTLSQWEAHRCRTPTNTKKKVVHGVVLDSRRRAAEYWFTKDEIEPWRVVSRVSDMVKRAARDADGNRLVYHVHNPKRVSQTRGVTVFAPIVNTVSNTDDLMFAQLVKAQLAASFALIIERGVDFPAMSNVQTGPRSDTVHSDGSEKFVEGVSPGMNFRGDPGDRLRFESPNVPNTEFFQHARLLLMMVAVNLGLPLNLLLLDASDTNFSGHRGAVDQARMGFRRIQRWIAGRFVRPVWQWRVSVAATRDPVLARAMKRTDVRLFHALYRPPSWKYIEPLKDSSSDLLQVQNGLSPLRRVYAERGMDFKKDGLDCLRDIAKLVRLAKELAQEINTEINDSDPVGWREIMRLPTPDGVQMALQVGMQETNQPNQATQGKTDE